MLKNIIIKMLVVISVLIFLICSSILLKDYFSYKNNNKSTEKLIENVITTDIETKETSINWEELHQVNSDIIAWIEIENTNVNYPILKDNKLYYLNHSYDKKYNKNGSIFTIDTNPFDCEETTIYGHNMKNGSMFSDLGKYLKRDFLDSHRIIKIYTPTKDYKGIIFSAYSIGFDDENNNIKSLGFKERINYYKNVSKYSIYNNESISKIVKLSTCSYINAHTTPTDQRYYIIAYLIPISE